MLVYSSQLYFRPATLAEGLDIAVSWLSTKVGKALRLADFQERPEITCGGGHRIRIAQETANSHHLVGIRYTHPDREISGRQWQVELGFRKAFNTDTLECSTLLQTSEISARVVSPVQPTRPGIVVELLRGLQSAPQTAGLELAVFGEEDALVLSQTIDHPDRSAPLVLISPTPEGTYLVNHQRLREVLTGIADVAIIRSPEDAQWLSRRLGQERTAWGGAVKVLDTPNRGRRTPYRYYTSDQLRALVAAGQSADTEILSAVLHRTNLPLSRRHLSLERIREEGLQARLASSRARLSKTAAAEEQVRYLEDILEVASEAERGFKARIAQLESENEELEAQINHLEDELRRSGFDIEALKHQLDAMEGGSRPADEEDVAAGRTAMTRLMDDEGSVADALTIVDSLYSDVATVLPSAWDSVKDSKHFRHPRKALSLLLALVGPYRDKLSNGVPDGEARQLFGTAYAAKESESVMSNAAGKARRTFIYKGTPVQMFAHLKIGVKDSKAETLRIHFHWDSEVRKVVIGYCGPHLDFD